MPPEIAVIKARRAGQKPASLLAEYPESGEVLRAAYAYRDDVPPRAAVEAALRKEPDDAVLAWIAARAAWASGDVVAAHQHVRHAMGLAPWSGELRLLLLHFDLAERRCIDAHADWTQLVPLMPEGTLEREPVFKLLQQCPVFE
ncbi:MAG: hypothetical protein QM817_14170 [Archangium sp.]